MASVLLVFDETNPFAPHVVVLCLSALEPHGENVTFGLFRVAYHAVLFALPAVFFVQEPLLVAEAFHSDGVLANLRVFLEQTNENGMITSQTTKCTYSRSVSPKAC